MQDIIKRTNVISIMGNHEYTILPTLEGLSYSNKSSQEEIIRNELNIMDIGQEETLLDFCQLAKQEQYEIIDYLKYLPLYVEITIKSQDYLLIHAGLPDFDDMTAIDFCTEDELLLGPHDFSIKHFDDTIAIDCGCGFGGKLGVLCLDTGEEMYF